MDKILPLYVDVINGEVQEFPVKFPFQKNLMVPMGETTIRYFNDDMCSVARRTFLIRYGDDLFGTNQFKSVRDFWQWQNFSERGGGYFLIEGCSIQIDGINITF